MKKILIAILLLLLALPTLCGVAFADDTVYTEGALYFTVADESITIVGYFGSDPEVTVPAMIAGFPVNVIGKGAFIGTEAKVVYLPDCIMEVQEGAFDVGVSAVYNSNTDEPFTVGGNSEVPVVPDDPVPPEEQPIVTDITSSQPSAPVAGLAENIASSDYSIEEVELDLDEVLSDAEPEPTETPEPSPEPSPEPTEAPAETAAPEAPAETKSASGTVIIVIAAVVVIAAAVVLLTKKKK